jgi:hypothetical protein
MKGAIMSEEQTQLTEVQEAIQLVEEAQSPKVFNLADAIKGRAYPKKDVVVYLDDETALRLVEINDIMNESLDAAEVSKLEAEALLLSEKIKESAVIVSMRGVNQAAIEKILEDCNTRHGIAKDEDPLGNPTWFKDYVTLLVAANIEHVSDGNGNIDDEKFTYDKIEELRKNIPANEWAKLVEAMQRLTLAGGYFEQLTDAGFLQKS